MFDDEKKFISARKIIILISIKTTQKAFHLSPFNLVHKKGIQFVLGTVLVPVQSPGSSKGFNSHWDHFLSTSGINHVLY